MNHSLVYNNHYFVELSNHEKTFIHTTTAISITRRLPVQGKFQGLNTFYEKIYESQNVRFEVNTVELLKDIESDFCKSRHMNRSDLIRHLVRIGLSSFNKNQPKNRKMLSELTDEIAIMGKSIR